MMTRRHMLYLGCALTAGLIIGIAWPPATPSPSKALQGEWSLPNQDAISRHNPRDLATVTADIKWGSEAKAGNDKVATAGAWRLVGILRDSGLTALVMPPDASTEATRVAIGETLPDGSTLVAIKGDTVTTENHSCRTTYQMFLPAPVNQSDGCAQTDVPNP